ncbi:DUF2797 domain-containing protein [Marinobacteraceae bacterium S3BR75-40.1]
MGWQKLAEGALEKMGVEADAPVSYRLRLGDTRVPANDLIGRTIRLTHEGAINCRHCGRATRKSFGQGHCYPCFRSLAACDTCIMSPEKCHYHLGTCREPEWGEQHCFQPHIVYLANASGLKVGITRQTQTPVRWMDQGAVSALPMLRVSSRYLAGLIEVACKAHVADRTNWRAMLKGDVTALDLAAEKDRLLELVAPELSSLAERFGEEAIETLDVSPWQFEYPVTQFPTKIVSHNLDKNPVLEGRLEGIKGQYLILDTAVINIRKYTAYNVSLETQTG